MKKCFTFSLLLGSAIPSFGQGYVSFVNSELTLISTNAYHGGPALGPTVPAPDFGGGSPPRYFFALFAAASTVTTVSGVMDPNWTFTGLYATNTTASSGGRLACTAKASTGPHTMTNVPPFTTFNFLVRGWSDSIAGLDWPAVQSFMHGIETGSGPPGSPGQVFGSSPIATILVQGIPNPPPRVFGTTDGTTIPGFLLDQVPLTSPPTVITLGGLTLTASQIQFSITLGSGSASSFTLLQAPQPWGPWTTNTAALLTPVEGGSSYALSAPRGSEQRQFYRVRSP